MLQLNVYFLIYVFLFIFQLSVTEIKAEMERTLKWLVAVATNTAKYELILINKSFFLSRLSNSKSIPLQFQLSQ